MNIRMQFAKYGKMIYIGHLDVMRYFQKALRRAKVDMAFTQGFSPHPILSFAAPLGVGIESCGEYADLRVYRSDTTEAMTERLNAVMAEGIQVMDWRLLPEDAPNAMSSVAAADYMVTFRENAKIKQCSEWIKHYYTFIEQSSIATEKETKKGPKTVDIRPLILDNSLELKEDKEPALFFQLSAGSAGNLKPELILSAFYQYLGLPFQEEELRICRLETYTSAADSEGNTRLIPLREAGIPILQPLEEPGEEKEKNLP